MIYQSSRDLFDNLPDECLRPLINAIFNYAYDRKMTELPEDAIPVFEEIRRSIDRDRLKYKEKCYNSQFNGLSDSEIDSVIFDTAPRGHDEDVMRIVDKFNKICYSLPKVEEPSKSAAENIKKCICKFTEDKIEDAFMKTQRSKFLTGQKSCPWKASLEWVTSPENMQKILNGVYDDRDRARRDTSRYCENRVETPPQKEEPPRGKRVEVKLDDSFLYEGYKNMGFPDSDIEKIRDGTYEHKFKEKPPKEKTSRE